MNPISVVYDHQDFLIINKPNNIAVQDQESAQGVLPYLRTQTGIDKLWLIHRLDKVTSGLLILAKNQAAASRLSQLFSQRMINKFYIALSNKRPKKKQGTVSGDMRKVRDGVWMLEKSTLAPAVSQFFSFGQDKGARLFMVKPYTGKTHQIRVMMKSLGCPILGDKSYKGEDADRVYLHAFKLTFNYQGESINVSCLPQTGVKFTEPGFKDKIESIGVPEAFTWPALKPALLKTIGKKSEQDE